MNKIQEIATRVLNCSYSISVKAPKIFANKVCEIIRYRVSGIDNRLKMTDAKDPDYYNKPCSRNIEEVVDLENKVVVKETPKPHEHINEEIQNLNVLLKVLSNYEKNANTNKEVPGSSSNMDLAVMIANNDAEKIMDGFYDFSDKTEEECCLYKELIQLKIEALEDCFIKAVEDYHKVEVATKKFMFDKLTMKECKNLKTLLIFLKVERNSPEKQTGKSNPNDIDIVSNVSEHNAEGIIKGLSCITDDQSDKYKECIQEKIKVLENNGIEKCQNKVEMEAAINMEISNTRLSKAFTLFSKYNENNEAVGKNSDTAIDQLTKFKEAYENTFDSLFKEVFYEAKNNFSGKTEKSAVPVTDTTLGITAMPQATYLGDKRYHTQKASSKECESEKDIGVTALARSGVQSRAGIAAEECCSIPGLLLSDQFITMRKGELIHTENMAPRYCKVRDLLFMYKYVLKKNITSEGSSKRPYNIYSSGFFEEGHPLKNIREIFNNNIKRLANEVDQNINSPDKYGYDERYGSLKLLPHLKAEGACYAEIMALPN